ncbi:MAG: hypothetical protein NZM04_09435 [Methylacidiphilales bacterium]|nr:hypothetical protein [Candidatus Methylacidiphilales bacterium]
MGKLVYISGLASSSKTMSLILNHVEASQSRSSALIFNSAEDALNTCDMYTRQDFLSTRNIIPEMASMIKETLNKKGTVKSLLQFVRNSLPADNLPAWDGKEMATYHQRRSAILKVAQEYKEHPFVKKFLDSTLVDTPILRLSLCPPGKIMDVSNLPHRKMMLEMSQNNKVTEEILRGTDKILHDQNLYDPSDLMCRALTHIYRHKTTIPDNLFFDSVETFDILGLELIIALTNTTQTKITVASDICYEGIIGSATGMLYQTLNEIKKQNNASDDLEGIFYAPSRTLSHISNDLLLIDPISIIKPSLKTYRHPTISNVKNIKFSYKRYADEKQELQSVYLHVMEALSRGQSVAVVSPSLYILDLITDFLVSMRCQVICHDSLRDALSDMIFEFANCVQKKEITPEKIAKICSLLSSEYKPSAELKSNFYSKEINQLKQINSTERAVINFYNSVNKSNSRNFYDMLREISMSSALPNLLNHSRYLTERSPIYHGKIERLREQIATHHRNIDISSSEMLQLLKQINYINNIGLPQKNVVYILRTNQLHNRKFDCVIAPFSSQEIWKVNQKAWENYGTLAFRFADFYAILAASNQTVKMSMPLYLYQGKNKVSQTDLPYVKFILDSLVRRNMQNMAANI